MAGNRHGLLTTGVQHPLIHIASFGIGFHGPRAVVSSVTSDGGQLQLATFLTILERQLQLWVPVQFGIS